VLSCRHESLRCVPSYRSEIRRYVPNCQSRYESLHCGPSYRSEIRRYVPNCQSRYEIRR
jgi:hypothetical protein